MSRNMAGVNLSDREKSLTQQMTDLLERDSDNYDVTFSVGTEKIKVQGVQFVLKAASPVFARDFKNNWNSLIKKNEKPVEIPLPDIDPNLFKLLIKMITRDKWSLPELLKLKFLPVTLLGLRDLCKRFEITKAIKNLEGSIRDFTQHFHNFQDTDEFLNISRQNLKTILSFEGISLEESEVFECACRWAENQCKGEEGSNLREVLGDCVYQIRFPTMQFQDFTKISRSDKNILTADEKVAIFEFIGMEEGEKLSFLKSAPQFPFNLIPRGSFGCSVLSLPPTVFKVAEGLPFECNGAQKRYLFQVNQRISLHGIGFLGPVDQDSHYNIDVHITKMLDDSLVVYHPTFNTRVGSHFARNGRKFHLLFEKPITVEPNEYDSSWRSYYRIISSIRGDAAISQYKVEIPKEETLNISDVEFHLNSNWTNGSPLAELLFKKI